MSNEQKWSRVTLKTKNLNIPQVCPNCMRPGEFAVESTYLGAGSGATGRLYYCGNCAAAAESVNSLRGKFFLYMIVILPFAYPLYWWQKKQAMKAYPIRDDQATWGYAAKATHVSIMFSSYSFKAARPEWIEALIAANPDAKVEDLDLQQVMLRHHS